MLADSPPMQAASRIDRGKLKLIISTPFCFYRRMSRWVGPFHYGETLSDVHAARKAPFRIYENAPSGFAPADQLFSTPRPACWRIRPTSCHARGSSARKRDRLEEETPSRVAASE